MRLSMSTNGMSRSNGIDFHNDGLVGLRDKFIITYRQ